MTDLPAPPVQANLDVSKLAGFMLNVDKLMNSVLWASSTGDEFKAALGLWCRAWKQVPAGSLPDDERVLAAWSGAGSKWRKVRDAAMRGFELCADGRYYHGVLCDDAIRASKARQQRQDAIAKRWGKDGAQAPEQPPKEDSNNGCDTAEDTAVLRKPFHRRDGDETDKKEGGDVGAPARPPTEILDASADQQRRLFDAAGWGWDDPAFAGNGHRLQAWLTSGADFELDILPTVRRLAVAKSDGPPRSLKYFERAVADAKATRLSPMPEGSPHAARSPAARRPQAGSPDADHLIRRGLGRAFADCLEPRDAADAEPG